MGLITLIFLIALTALYLSKSLEKKPELLTVAVEKITENIDQLTLWAAVWGLVGIVLTLLMSYDGTGMLIRLVANVLVVLMALPFIFDRLVAKYQEKVNPAILNEAKNIVGWVTKNEKYIGYAGATLSVLLFVIIFRHL